MRLGSVVEVRPGLDPVEQALRDAGALAADPSVPSDVAARTVPDCRVQHPASQTSLMVGVVPAVRMSWAIPSAAEASTMILTINCA
jgi:hypothetical protein